MHRASRRFRKLDRLGFTIDLYKKTLGFSTRLYKTWGIPPLHQANYLGPRFISTFLVGKPIKGPSRFLFHVLISIVCRFFGLPSPLAVYKAATVLVGTTDRALVLGRHSIVSGLYNR